MAGVKLRPLGVDDVEAVVAVNRAAAMAAGWGDADKPPERVARWHDTLRYMATRDPDGCWLAESDGAVTGFAVAIRRGAFWGLSLLFVHPDWQGNGIGAALLGRALESAEGATVGMIMASADPRALRRYWFAGFDLHPGLQLKGTIDRTRLPSGLAGRQGSDTDLDLVDAVDVPLRAASRRDDVAHLLGHGLALVVVDGSEGRGFVVHDNGKVAMLGADNTDVARTLLWRAFAEAPSDGETDLWGVTGTQSWAIDVAMSARLAVTPGGALFLRGLPAPPAAYLPSGIFF